MSNKARLGIDIVGRDRTQGAFRSTQRALDGINRSVRTIKMGLAGFAGGNILANVIRSFVQINRSSAPVAAAVNQMQRAWQAFALQVGAAGLNEGLISFSKRMGALLISTDGLSQSIGRFLGSGVRIMGAIFESIGRAIAFAYDNAQIFIRVFAAMAAMNIAIRIVSAARAFVLLITALKAASVATALFHLVSRRALVVWAGAAAIFASATGTLDELQQAMGWVWQQAEQLIPTIDGGVALALRRMGFDVKSLTTDLGAFEGQLAGLPPLFSEIAASNTTLGKPLDITTKAFGAAKTATNEYLTTLKGFFSDVASGTKPIDALTSSLRRLSSQLTDKAIDMIFASITGSMGAGGTGFPAWASFGGFYASGGNLGAGKWGVAGENGPEIVRGPASIIPAGGSGGSTSVNVHNYASAQVETRSSGWGDRRRTDIILRDKMANAASDPTSSFSGVLGARGAGVPLKRR